MRSTFDPICIHKMADLMSDGRQLANEKGRPILVSLSRPLDFDPDPAQLFYAASRIDDIRNFWSKPAEGCWIVGAGKAAEIRVEGVERFQKATNSLRTMLSSGILDEEEGGPGPIFLGGFSFRAGGSAEEIWEDFPDCLLTLPRLAVVCRGDCRRWFVINAMISGETDLNSLLNDIGTQATILLEHPVDVPSSERASLEPATNHWRGNVERVLDQIKDGRLMKVTLARTLKVTSEHSIVPDSVLRSLVANYPECSVFAFCRKGVCFIGASPEELVSLNGSTVSSTCLAGSAPRGASEDEDSRLSAWLLDNVKERNEHEFVVDWVSERMGKLCRKLQYESTPDVIRLGNLQHLETRFVGKPKGDIHILDFLSELHPTPAVGGIPLDAALETIEMFEEYDRGWYTGPVGWVDKNGFGSFAIAIRCALLRGNQAILYAGSGIVAGSDPDREYQETNIKFKPLLTALGIV